MQRELRHKRGLPRPRWRQPSPVGRARIASRGFLDTVGRGGERSHGHQIGGSALEPGGRKLGDLVQIARAQDGAALPQDQIPSNLQDAAVRERPVHGTRLTCVLGQLPPHSRPHFATLLRPRLVNAILPFLTISAPCWSLYPLARPS